MTATRRPADPGRSGRGNDSPTHTASAILRRLTASDAPAYRAVMLDAYERHPEAFTSTVSERSALPLSWWEQRVDSANERVVGAFLDDELAGAAGLSRESRERTRHKALLFGMYVPHRHRRSGLGRALVQAVLTEAAGWPGLRVVQLTLTEGNAAAQRLYESCGFRIFGVEPVGLCIDGQDFGKIHMWTPVPAPQPEHP
jgi:RimJ/RimL family protein N-acetyltransferase